MNRLPKGLRRVSKEEFVNKTLAIKEEKEFLSTFNDRIGIEWSKINEKTESKNSIRW